MNIRKIGFWQFRNLQPATLCLQDGVNVFFGDNAQGKTNLLEGIWLFCGAKSFRGAKEEEMLQFGAPFFKLEMEFVSQGRTQQASILSKREGGREVLLNEVKKRSSAELAGHFCAVVFSPTHLSLIKDGPNVRRKFLDAAICQHKPGYIKLMGDYHKALQQKNALLKDVWRHSQLLDELDTWDRILANLCAQVYKERVKYVQTLNPFAQEIYGGFSQQKETLSLFYVSQDLQGFDKALEIEELQQAFYSAILQKRREEIRLGFAQTGVQRDDLEIQINQKSARQFASQGQQRSAVLSLKLAEANSLKQHLEEMPVILLDDVLSELDQNRQNYILHALKGAQVVITGCEPIQNAGACRVFLVNDGKVSQKEL